MGEDKRLQQAETRIKTLEARIEDLSSLIHVTNIINSTLEPDKVLALVMETAQEVMRAEASSIFLVNESNNMLECEIALGTVSEKLTKVIRLKKGQGVAGWVWEHEKSLIVPDVDKDERFFSDVDEKSGFHTHSILAAPLVVQGKLIGVGEVINRLDGYEFDENDLNLFETFCSQVALAIENARVHQMEVDQARMNLQLEAARDIQQSFMPTDLPWCPEGTFEVAARNEPAAAVGGDLFDILKLDDDHIGVLIGDVSGKGIPAALYMARLTSDFRFFVQQDWQPVPLFQQLNELLIERSRYGMFVTLQFCVINRITGHVTCCDAGHLPFFQVHNQQAITHDVRSGPPLGITTSLQFEVYEFDLQPGDTLCFYTDGLVEAKNMHRQEFERSRLQTILSKEWSSSVQVIDELLQSVRQFTNFKAPHDDLTVVAFRWFGLHNS